jgi:hypothetical protein
MDGYLPWFTMVYYGYLPITYIIYIYITNGYLLHCQWMSHPLLNSLSSKEWRSDSSRCKVRKSEEDRIDGIIYTHDGSMVLVYIYKYIT